jgi:hypothetical protein
MESQDFRFTQTLEVYDKARGDEEIPEKDLFKEGQYQCAVK